MLGIWGPPVAMPLAAVTAKTDKPCHGHAWPNTSPDAAPLLTPSIGKGGDEAEEAAREKGDQVLKVSRWPQSGVGDLESDHPTGHPKASWHFEPEFAWQLSIEENIHLTPRLANDLIPQVEKAIGVELRDGVTIGY